MSADVWRDPRRRAIVAVVAVQVLVLVLILAYVWLGSRHVAARVLGPSGAQEHSPTR